MNKNLKDTVALMLSDKFEERLEAECAQLDIRLEGLTKFINSEKFNSVSPTQRSLLKIQSLFGDYFRKSNRPRNCI